MPSNIVPFARIEGHQHSWQRSPESNGEADEGMSCTLLGHPLDIKDPVSRLAHRFDLLYAKQAYTHLNSLYDRFELSEAREHIAWAERDMHVDLGESDNDDDDYGLEGGGEEEWE